jgi:hypothetical protein
MNKSRLIILSALSLTLLSSAAAQSTDQLPPEQAPHVLSSAELKKAVPTEYFFRGQKAPVQLRNAVGFQSSVGKITLAALVDASGYSSAIQQKYQGMLITETKLTIGGSSLTPGQYGFGFTAEGKFIVMDVANNDVLNTDYQNDQAVQHPVPLKLVEEGSSYKLYAGRKWVTLKPE